MTQHVTPLTPKTKLQPNAIINVRGNGNTPIIRDVPAIINPAIPHLAITPYEPNPGMEWRGEYRITHVATGCVCGPTFSSVRAARIGLWIENSMFPELATITPDNAQQVLMQSFTKLPPAYRQWIRDGV